ncbi:MAG: RNA polymerase sigma factor [Candidatus Glassbacteria bacterium]
MSLKDDGSLVALCKSGDREAFGELVRRYQRPVYYLALRLIGDSDEANDLAQEVFLRAYRGIENFRGSSTFKTWLYTIANNLIKNHYRSARRRMTVSIEGREIPVNADEMENLLSKEMSEILRGAIAELPYKQRMALTLRIYDGLTHREIADVLGCSEGTVKVNFHHAINSLRKRMVPIGKGGRNEL